MALVLAGDDRWLQVSAAAVLAAAAVTDYFDGYLARRWGESTTLGTFLDTAADKLLVSGVLIALVAVDAASAWVAFVIVGRELVIMGVRAAVAAEGTVMVPSIWGKLKANVQFAALVLAVLDVHQAAGPLAVDEWALAVAAAVTALSGLDYLVRFWMSLRGTAATAEPLRPESSLRAQTYDETTVSG